MACKKHTAASAAVKCADLSRDGGRAVLPGDSRRGRREEFLTLILPSAFRLLNSKQGLVTSTPTILLLAAVLVVDFMATKEHREHMDNIVVI